MQVATDFREYRRGRPPGDWSAIWIAATESAVGRAFVDLPDQAYLECWHAEGQSGWAGITLDPLDGTGDVEVLVLLSHGQNAPKPSYQVGVRLTGPAAAENGLLLKTNLAAPWLTVQLAALDAGAVSSASLPIAMTIAPLHPVWVRFLLTGTGGGKLASIKAWPAGTDEPVDWDQEDVGLGAYNIPNTGRVGVLAAPDQGDGRIHAFAVGTAGDAAPSLPKEAAAALEAGRPWYLAECVVMDDVGTETTLWFGERGWTPSVADWPSSTDTDAVPPVLGSDFEIDQVLDLDELEALVPERLQSLRLSDPAIAGDPVPSYPVREAVLSHRWTDGVVFLYAVPLKASSLRERVVVAAGRPAAEPAVEAGMIDVPLNSMAERIASSSLVVKRHVGSPLGWRRITGNHNVVVPYHATYAVQEFTLFCRFQTPAFDTGAGAISRLWRRIGTGTNIWTEVLAISANRLRWWIGDSAATEVLFDTPAALDLSDDQPHSLVLGLDSNRRWWVAIDGVVLGEGVPGRKPALTTTDTWIGFNIDGWVSDFRMRRYMEPEQALPMMETTPGPDDVDLGYLGFWAFNDGAGSLVTDYSATGNDATASGTEDTHFEWVPTDLGMIELAGKTMPFAHGRFWQAAAERIDPQNSRYRLTDRGISLPAAPSIALRSKGFEVSETDQGGGVVSTDSGLDEPVTWGQLQEVNYEELLVETLPLRLGLALDVDIDRNSIAALARLCPDAAGVAFAGGETVEPRELLKRLLGGVGAHLYQAEDGMAVLGYLLPPVSPGPIADSPVLEWVGLPRPVIVPPPSTSRFADYTVCCWVKIFSGFGTAATHPDEFLTDEMVPGSAFATHYLPGEAEVRFLLGTDNRARSGLMFGDTFSAAPLTVKAPGALPAGEWVFVAGVADSVAGERRIYRMLQGGSAVELLATGGYSGVGAADRPGDVYTALGVRPGGLSASVGSICHYALWGDALTASELDTVATGTPADHAADLLSYVPATEGEGQIVRDIEAGGAALVQGQRWAPRRVFDLWAMRSTAALGREYRQRPLREVEVKFRRNTRPVTGQDLSGSLSAAERQAMIEPWRSEKWQLGPVDGVSLVLETPFYSSISPQRLLELVRLRRGVTRYVRELLLSGGAGRELRLLDEVRLENVPGVGSFVGRVVSPRRRATSLTADLWG